MVDDVLMEFDGHLSITDIYNLTYKELDMLRTHRKKYGKDYHSAKGLTGMLGGMPPMAPASPQPEQKSKVPNLNDPHYIPGSYQR